MTFKVGQIMAYPSMTAVTVANIQPDEIHIEDICCSLSHMPRFAGHTPVLQTVAEHSVLVWYVVREAGGTWDEQRWALAHDFSEAYIMDMPKPIKDLPEMAPYRAMEDRIHSAIAERFNLSPEIPDIVHKADAERGRIDLQSGRFSNRAWSSIDAFDYLWSAIGELQFQRYPYLR